MEAPRSDAAGLLTIDRMPLAARVAVRVKHPEFAAVTVETTADGPARAEPVVMDRGLPVTVDVVVAATGEPALGAKVSVTGSAAYGAPVDSAGRFTTRVERFANFNVQVEHPSLLPRSRVAIHEQVVQPGWHWRYELVPRARAIGRVVDQDDFRPLAGGNESELRQATAADVRRPDELDCRGWINSPPLSLAALRGKVVLLDYWATWCAPSVERLHERQRLHETFSPMGLVIVGVHHDSITEDRLREFVAERQLSFPICIENSRDDTSGRWKPTPLPHTIVIARDGRIIPARNRENLWRTLRGAVLEREAP